MQTATINRIIDLYVSGNQEQAHELLSKMSDTDLITLISLIRKRQMELN